jgi:chromosome partitioning protein
MNKKVYVALLTKKGGSGKSTISVCLAAAISAQHPHLKVVVADADSQKSALTWINRGKGAAGISAVAICADGEGKLLQQELNEIDANVVIIDLPPALEVLSLRAALRSNLILIPVLPSILDLAACKSAIEIVKEAVELIPDKKYLLIPNRVQNNTAAGRQLRGDLATWGPVSDVTICQRIAYSEAAVYGLGVSQYCPEGPAAQEMGMLSEQVCQMLDIK